MEKKFISSLSNLSGMLDFVLEKAILAGLDAKGLSHVELSVEEALVNIIMHSGIDNQGIIHIRCSITAEPQGIEIQLYDEGIPFNPLDNPDHHQIQIKREREEPGGYGIHLYTQYMDKIEYRRIGDNINALTMTKYVTK